MSNNNSNLTSRHLRSIATAATLLGLGTIVSGAHAAVQNFRINEISRLD